MKFRLAVCDANTASWLVISNPLTALMFLYPAACHCVALALRSDFRIALEGWVSLRGGLRDLFSCKQNTCVN